MATDDKLNILLVDDQPGKLLSYETILAGMNETILKASSGREALEHLLKSDVAVSVAAKLREAGIYDPAPQPGGGVEGKTGPEGKKPEAGGSPDSWSNDTRLSRRNS